MEIRRKHTVIAVFIIMSMMFASFGVFTPVEAASVKAPGRTALSSVKTVSQSQIKITWKKVKGVKGYQVQRYQNGKWITVKKLNKLTLTDSKLKAGTKYSYRVRAYKTYKQTKWYNKKTEKWVAKKPAKKVCGKSKKVAAYKYGKWSKAKAATTKKTAANPAAPKPAHQHNYNIPFYGIRPELLEVTIYHCMRCDKTLILYKNDDFGTNNEVSEEIDRHIWEVYNETYDAMYPRFNSSDPYERLIAQQEWDSICNSLLHAFWTEGATVSTGDKRGVIGYKCSCGAKHYIRNDVISEE